MNMQNSMIKKKYFRRTVKQFFHIIRYLLVTHCEDWAAKGTIIWLRYQGINLSPMEMYCVVLNGESIGEDGIRNEERSTSKGMYIEPPS